MPHPPHKLADGSADVHAEDCPRCSEIMRRWTRGWFTVPLTDFQRIDAILDAEDAQEAANKEAK